MRKAVYAGSFDPITNGHLWMIEEGTKLFDELVVAIGVHPGKKYTFSPNERVEMVKESILGYSNAYVDSINIKYLVDYASSINAEYLLRGIRSEKDYEFEKSMRHMNRRLNDKIVSVFLMPPKELEETSSSAVKELIGYEGWEEAIKEYVPAPVYRKLIEKFKK